MNVRNIPRLVTDALVAQYNKLRADIAKGALGTVLHTGTVPSTIAALDTNDLPAATNILVTAYEAHRVSVFSGTTGLGAHSSSDTANAVSAAAATDLATAITRANELKGDLNAHIAVTTKHIAASSAAVAAADATDAPTLITLLTDIDAVLRAHVGNAFASEPITLVAP